MISEFSSASNGGGSAGGSRSKTQGQYAALHCQLNNFNIVTLANVNITTIEDCIVHQPSSSSESCRSSSLSLSLSEGGGPGGGPGGLLLRDK